MSRTAIAFTLGIAVLSLVAAVAIAKAQIDPTGTYGWILSAPWLMPLLTAISSLAFFLCVREWKPFQVALWAIFEWLVPRPQARFVLLHEIVFDYLQNRSVRLTPLDKGWKRGYGEGIPEFASDPACPDNLFMQVRTKSYAMDYPVPQHAKLSTHVLFTAKFIQDAFFFVQVEVIDPNGQNPETFWVSHVIGQKAPQYLEEYNEWKFFVSPVNDAFNLSLTDEVDKAVGARGKVFSEIKVVRLRGSLSISPIKLGRVQEP